MKYAFTMAEILLSLTIIGVVAAITLPSLTGNINERTWNTQRKALYARMSQAIALMPALNGYGTFTEASSEGASDAVDTATETFITAGLSKVLKINNICSSTNIADCGIVSTITPLNGPSIITPTTMRGLNNRMSYVANSAGSVYSIPDTNAAAFETQNGESILVFYNPNCVADAAEKTQNIYFQTQPKVCANFIYDLNGNKGPNTVGKDIGFMTILYPSDSIIAAPNLATQKAELAVKHQDAVGACKKQDQDYRIPTLEELISMFVNQRLISGVYAEENVELHWSSVTTSFDTNRAWAMSFVFGRLIPHEKTKEFNVRCIKR